MVSALQKDPHQQEVGECMTVRQEVVFSSTPRLSHSFSLSAGKLEMLRLKHSVLIHAQRGTQIEWQSVNELNRETVAKINRG